jgi:WD40 repeat protein
MSQQRVPAGVIACLALLPCAAGAEPPAAPGRDRYGDRLPPGAVARLGTERLTLSQARSLAFSPDGRYLAAAATGHPPDLRVWEVTSGREILRKRPPTVNGPWFGWAPLAFSPDGKALALGCADQTVRVWEVVTGKELHAFGRLPGPLMGLAFGPDCRSLFAAARGSVFCWDLTRPGPPRTFGDFETVHALAVSRDGKTLTANAGPEIVVRQRTFVRWDIASGKEIGRRSLTAAAGWSFPLSPDGRAFAAPGADGKSFALFDPLTGRELARAEESDHAGLPIFSADCTTMARTDRDGAVRVWEVATGKLRARFRALPTRLNGIALSPDGKVVAVVNNLADAAVHLWDVAAGRELHSFPGHRGGPLTVAFVGGGREVATVSRVAGYTRPTPEWGDWSLCRWDAATGDLRAAVRCRPPGEVHFTGFSADGRRVVTVLHEGTWQLWDVEAGKELRTWKVPYAPPAYTSKGKNMLAPPAFSPDGRVLLAATGPTVDRWEVGTGKELPTFPVEGLTSPPVNCVASPDGRTIAVKSGGRVALLGAADGKVLHRLEGFPDIWPRPAFSRDGRTLAVPEERGAVSLWEVASGRPRGRLAGGPAVAFALAFSPDGRLLAGGGPEGAVSLWDLATGEVAGRLRADLGAVGSLAFSPDSSRLAFAGTSPAALVCDVAVLCGKTELGQLVRLPAPSAEELEGLCADLAGADGARAYRAVLRLGAAGPQGAALLKRRLKSGPTPDEARIARFIADLDSNDFATREKATAALEALSQKAGPALRRAAEKAASAEARTRARRLLKRLDRPAAELPSRELIRLRAVEALEANGTPEARAVLAELAAGPAADALTGEAKASLQRLARRARPPDSHDGRRSR